ncbi:unnamed protein product [Caenorhabditis auriculariae]|uniref:Caspase family p20 domain-containing protein n=1 Tax=Caenorhabditis auriculariae TaxID=2777116 RepID=A0A8S1HZ23_9PELO|nr:unnamed protein product [Caenorhabditis auriculariae]
MAALSTNLADLPLQTFHQLSHCLTNNDLWLEIVDTNHLTIYSMSADEVETLRRQRNPGEAALRLWGNRGQTVQDFLARLQQLSKISRALDNPQLILSRKFKELRWGRSEQVTISVTESTIRLDCKAVGFPSPNILWYKGDDTISDERILEIPRCACVARWTFRCFAHNEVREGFSFSAFYRRAGKQFSSTLESKEIDVAPFIRESDLCDKCRPNSYNDLREIMNLNNDESPQQNVQSLNQEDESLIAADKVAMIISNCAYRHLPELVTPHCDAETLAMALQEMKYKTVTLADLTLEEMKFVLKEYRKLLGNGVYAVFYFVGHGFEVNGQCYLLAVDAPADAHQPKHSLSMDWVLSTFRDYNPALNLILLDVCRKFIPYECIPAFVEYAEQFKARHRPSRNVVYGYSTSGGVGAYEVKGEINGVFMKYLKNHVMLNRSVFDMLNRVLKDIEEDKKVCDVQVPEVRSTLSRPRSLCDPLVFDGHTFSFDHHTLHWRLMHELPNPVIVRFEAECLCVTIWFDFCGHFTNKVYVFSSVGDLRSETNDDDDDVRLSQKALEHRAYLSFVKDLHTTKEKIFTDDEEGVSMCWLLSNLQRNKGELTCCVDLKHISNLEKAVATKVTDIGHVLITRIEMLK